MEVELSGHFLHLVNLLLRVQFGDGDTGLAGHGKEPIDAALLDKDGGITQRVRLAFDRAAANFFSDKRAPSHPVSGRNTSSTADSES